MSNKKNRKSIPMVAKVKACLQAEVDSICPFCSSNDVGHFQIHHIDEDPGNNDIGNLMLVCPTCHSKITKGDISQTEVFKKKIQLISGQSKKTQQKDYVTFNGKVGNAIIGSQNTISIKNSAKKVIEKYPEGCIGYDQVRANYISRLIERFNEYKAYEVGKENVRYAAFASHLKKKFKIGPTRTIYNLPIDRFEELYSYIQSRIDNTKLARVKGPNHKNYSSFFEYSNEQRS